MVYLHSSLSSGLIATCSSFFFVVVVDRQRMGWNKHILLSLGGVKRYSQEYLVGHLPDAPPPPKICECVSDVTYITAYGGMHCHQAINYRYTYWRVLAANLFGDWQPAAAVSERRQKIDGLMNGAARAAAVEHRNTRELIAGWKWDSVTPRL